MVFGVRRCSRAILSGVLFLLLLHVVKLPLVAAAREHGIEEPESSSSGGASIRKTERHIYTILDHVILILVCLSFSAIFAGLTIGILCMDTLTLSIIASSGREPDRTHASRILPLRRQGHVTLCTLIISNMLMNVIVVQQLGALTELLCKFSYISGACKDNGGAPGIALFAVSTLLILIFTEIVPMSICKSKYSLAIAAAGCSVVRVARVLVYPVAMPLGLLLDRLVPHDAGQIYDRNELRKLMILHCEAHGERSGLATSELKLLIAAMDFQERKVCDIMKPMEEVTTVRVDDVLTPCLIESLWRSGRSRIPVQETSGGYRDVLIVKDLLSMPPLIEGATPLTIGEFVNGSARTALAVHKDTPLPTVLRMFQHAETQMLFVSGTDTVSLLTDENISMSMSVTLNQCTALRDTEIIGIVTLEDVLETLIKGEIYDEYDSYDFPAHTNSVLGEREVLLDLCGVPPPFSEPAQVPRVNFYSYYVQPGSDGTLTEAQIWAVAYYLTRSVPPFYLWHPGYVKMLLDECGVDQYTFPAPVPSGEAPSNSYPPLSGTLIAGNTEGTRDAPNSTNDLISRATEERAVLYRNGVESSVFTLILGGRVEVLVASCNSLLKQRSFDWLGEGALQLQRYIPDYDAVVLHPTRLYRIPRELYDRYQSFNNHYNRAFNAGLSAGRSHDGATILNVTSLEMSPIETKDHPDGAAYVDIGEEDHHPMSPESAYGTFRGARKPGSRYEEMKLLNAPK